MKGHTHYAVLCMLVYLRGLSTKPIVLSISPSRIPNEGVWLADKASLAEVVQVIWVGI